MRLCIRSNQQWPSCFKNCKSSWYPQNHQRVAAAWNKVAVCTMKNCFEECGITKRIAEDNNDELGEELTDVVKELVTQIDYDLTAEEYIDFDGKTCIGNYWTCHWFRSSELERSIRHACI